MITLKNKIVYDNQLSISIDKIEVLLRKSIVNKSRNLISCCENIENTIAVFLYAIKNNSRIIPIPIDFNDNLLDDIVRLYSPHIIITDHDLKINQDIEIIFINAMSNEPFCSKSTLEIPLNLNHYTYSLYLNENQELAGVPLTNLYFQKIVGFMTETLSVNLNDLFIYGNEKLLIDLPIWYQTVKNYGSLNICYNKEKLANPITNETAFMHISDLFKILANEDYKTIFGNYVKCIITIGNCLPDKDINEFTLFLKNNKIKWYNLFLFNNTVFVSNVFKDLSSNTHNHSGYPIKGEQIVILDENNRIQPIGIKGKIFVSQIASETENNEYTEKSLVNISGKKFIETEFEGVQKIDKKYYITKSNIARNDFWYEVTTNLFEKVLRKNDKVKEFYILKNTDTSNFTLALSLESEINEKEIDDYITSKLPFKSYSKLGIIKFNTLPKDRNGLINCDWLKEKKIFNSYELSTLQDTIEKTYPDSKVNILYNIIELPQEDLKSTITRESDLKNICTTKEIELDNKIDTKKSYLCGDQIKEINNKPLLISELLFNATYTNPNEEIICIDENGEKVILTYKHLLDKALKVSNALNNNNIQHKDKIIIHVKNLHKFFIAFWGCIIGGYVPVPIGIFKNYENNSSEIDSLNNITKLLNKPNIITENEYIELLKNKIKDLKIINFDDLHSDFNKVPECIIEENDISMILFTSGSTGVPKGVSLTHKNLLSREKAIIQLHNLNSSLISVNWMPIEHSAGLFMLHLKQMLLACKQVHCRPEYILKNPLNWLDLLSEYKASFTFAPNFAYALVSEALKKKKSYNWDFSTLKMIINAAEMVNADTSKEFIQHLIPYNISPKAMIPVWGMSETCAGVLYSNVFELGTTAGVNRLMKESLKSLVKKVENDENCITFVEIGKPIPGFEVRIVDENNRIVEQRKIGRLQVKGDQVTIGYYRNEEVNKQAFIDNWLDTGDLAFIMDDTVTMTGRLKDVIIINGINYNNNEIEALIEREVQELEPTFSVACAVKEENDLTEKLCIFYCPKNNIEISESSLKKNIAKVILTKMGIKADFIIPLNKEQIPKTTVGKLQRSKLCRKFENGEFKANKYIQTVTIKVKSNDNEILNCITDILKKEENFKNKIYSKIELIFHNITSSEIIRKDIFVSDINKIDKDDNKRSNKKLDEIDLKVISICRNILENYHLNIEDNFFEMGGNSLNATVLVFQLREQLNVNISISDIFRFNNIIDIADYIRSNSKGTELTRFPKCQPDLDNLYKPFPLNDLQYSYTIGRDAYFDMGGVSTHSYHEFTMKLNIETLNNAVNKVIERHSMLRVIMTSDNQQVILKETPKFNINIIDISNLPNEEKVKVVLNERAKMSHSINKLDEWPLFKMSAFKISTDEYFISFINDMIIMDGYSLTLFFKEIWFFYENPDKNLPSLEFTYRDYIIAYNELKKSKLYENSKKYWLDKLPSFPMAPNLFLEQEPSSIQTPRFKVIKQAMPASKWINLKKISRKNRITPVGLLCTVYAEVLSYWSNQDRFSLNLPIFNRLPFHKDVDKLIGELASVILLEINLSEGDSFWERASNVQNSLLKCLDHIHYSGVEFIREFSKHHKLRNKAAMPIVFTSVVFNEDDENKNGYKECSTERSIDSNVFMTSQTYLDSVVSEDHGNLFVSWSYCEDILDASVVETMFDHYMKYLEQLNDEVNRYDFNQKAYDEICKNKLLKSDVLYPNKLLIHEIFENIVENEPDRIALVYNDINISYSALNKKANQLSHLLKQMGIGPNIIVALLFDRNIDMITAILAIIKAGGCYLPIDIKIPIDRIEYMLENSNAQLLLSHKSIIENLNFNEKLNSQPEKNIYIKLNDSKIINTILLDSDHHKICEFDNKNPKIENIPSDLLYIIYTSGTTGKPKGVMIMHKNVVRLLFNDSPQYDLNKNDIWSMFFSYCFDVSVWEMYGAFLYGGKLIIVPKDITTNPSAFLSLLKKENVTILNQTPSAFYNLSDCETNTVSNELSLRYIIMCGEELKPSLLKKWRLKYPNHLLINQYGITETTVNNTFKIILDSDIESGISNIGESLSTLNVYILDKKLRKLPVGVPGEIYVSGDGVGKGYLQLDDLTNERFIKDPFYSDKIMYKSGDIARILKNGDVEFLGRIDDQIKIRGYRVELSEIDYHILQFSSVENVRTLIKENQYGDRILISFICWKSKENINDLKNYLTQKMPGYMVPGQFMSVKEIPLTSNGKVDKKALLSIVEYNDKVNEIPISNEDEKVIANIWSDILNININSREANFFELGGDSIAVIKIITQLNRHFATNISIKEFYENPTILTINKIISQKNVSNNKCEIIKHVEKREYYPVSFAQNRFLLMQLMNKGSMHLNLVQMYPLPKNTTIEKLHSIFTLIFERHDSFRTSFTFINGELVQKINNTFTLKIQDLTGNLKDIVNEFVKPHDLEKSPLIRIGMINTDLPYNILLLDVHHLIIDGISLDILMQEFNMLYTNQQLSKIKFQYKDFSLYEQKEFNNNKYIAQEKYWIEKLKDFEKIILPIHFPYTKKRSFRGKKKHFVIEQTDFLKLEKIKENEKLTLFMMLLSIYIILLTKLSGQRKIFVSSVSSGRNSSDLNNIFGVFVNQIMFRLEIKDNITFIEYLAEIKNEVIEVFANQDYPFDSIKRKMDSKNINLDINVGFTLQNFMKYEESDLDSKSRETLNVVAGLDLNLEAYQIDQVLHLDIIYNKDIFNDEWGELVAKDFIQIIHNVSRRPDMVISDLLMKEEKNTKEAISSIVDFDL